MEAHHHQQANTTAMHQQQTVLEQRNPDVAIKNRSASGGNTAKSKKRKRNQDLGPGAPRQPVNGILNGRRHSSELEFTHSDNPYRLCTLLERKEGASEGSKPECWLC